MASPSPRQSRTVQTEPDIARHLVLRITKPYPRPFDLAKLTQPFLRILRTEPGFPRTIVGGRVRNRLDRKELTVSDHIDARSWSHLLIDETLSQYELQDGAAEPNRMPRQQILPGLDEHDPRDFDLAPNPAIGIPGRPLMPHFFPQSTDRKAEGSFPGPAHIHVTALILNVLADDVPAQTVPGTMTGLIGLDPDDRSAMEGLPL